MKNLAVTLHEGMHPRFLHVVVLALALVVGLEGRFVSRQQRDLGPAALLRPGVDFLRRRLGYGGKCGVAADRIPGSVEPIHQRRAGRTRLVPVWAEHERVEQQRGLVSQTARRTSRAAPPCHHWPTGRRSPPSILRRAAAGGASPPRLSSSR